MSNKLIAGIIAAGVFFGLTFDAGLLVGKGETVTNTVTKTVKVDSVLPRAPAYDSSQADPSIPFTIECKGYSNRPKLTPKPPYTKKLIGYKVVTVCITTALPKKGPVG